MTRYRGDPRWMTARFAGRCEYGAEIAPGDPVFYFPHGKKLFGEACGRGAEASAKFEAEAFDEDNNRSL